MDYTGLDMWLRKHLLLREKSWNTNRTIYLMNLLERGYRINELFLDANCPSLAHFNCLVETVVHQRT